jgi:hypothetical protein
MQKRNSWRKRLMPTLIATLILSQAAFAFVSADSSSSTNYKVQNVQFGAGGSSSSCSTTYCAQSAIGDITAGTTSSKNYKMSFEHNPDDAPALEVITLGEAQNLGYLDVNHTSTAADIVKVLNYSGSGYSLEMTGAPPGQGTHNLDSLTTPTSAHTGAEQFGVNLVANNDPSVGSSPVEVATSTKNYGIPTDNYDTPNLFAYNNGDYVASSSGGDGETDYTISMIIDISNTTPLGHYSASFNTVVVPSY